MSSAPRVVVTGFGPFHHIAENSSTVAALDLQSKWNNIATQHNLSPELIIIPNVEVTYKSADEVVSNIWGSINPDLVIHVGLGGSEIALESKAGSGPYVPADNGDLPSNSSCGDSLCTQLDLLEPFNLLRHLGFKCAISNDAGSFICNYIYHRSLENNPQRTLFVHVPMISDEFSVDYLSDFLLILILTLCKQCAIPLSPDFEKHLQKQSIGRNS